MDHSWLNFLWAALVLPLSWLWVRQNRAEDELQRTARKAEKGISEQRVREIMKEEMGPVREDIKLLTNSIHQMNMDMQQSIHSLQLDTLQKIIKGNHD